MEAAYEKLKGQGKNTVDGIIQWMKDKNVIEEKKSEEQFKSNLNCTDQVDFNSFEKAVGKLSQEQQMTLKNLAEDLVSKGNEMSSSSSSSSSPTSAGSSDGSNKNKRQHLHGKKKSESDSDKKKSDSASNDSDAGGEEEDKVGEVFEKIEESGKNDVDSLVKWMGDSASMDEYFAKMKKDGKNDVDNLVKWMSDSILPVQEPAPARDDDYFGKIISTAKEAEEKARRLFEGSDAKNVELSTFKQAIAKIAEEQKKTVEDLTKTLAEQGPKFMDALAAGASAFKDALTKK